MNEIEEKKGQENAKGGTPTENSAEISDSAVGVESSPQSESSDLNAEFDTERVPPAVRERVQQMLAEAEREERAPTFDAGWGTPEDDTPSPADDCPDEPLIIHTEGAKSSNRKGRGKRGPDRWQRVRAMAEDMTRCISKNRRGKRCGASRLRWSVYCVFHDPELRKRRAQLAEPIPFEHPEEVQRLLGEAVEMVKAKRLSTRQANSIGYLSTLMLGNLTRIQEEREQAEIAGGQLRTEIDAAEAQRLLVLMKLEKDNDEEWNPA